MSRSTHTREASGAMLGLAFCLLLLPTPDARAGDVPATAEPTMAANSDTAFDSEPWRPRTSSDAGGAEDADTPPKSPFADWDEFIEEAELTEGMFNVYRKREDLYAEITPEHFERDYLIALSIASGIGSRYLLGGLPFGTAQVNLRRVGDHIQLYEPNPRFRGGDDPALQRAVDLSYGTSILHSFSIESENAETEAVLIDLGSFVRSDFPGAGFFLGVVLDTPVGLDRERTHVKGISSFPENIEIDVAYTFNPANRRGVNLDTVVDNRYIPVGIHYSLSVLPENDYVPRYADDRLGYFITAHQDFSRYTEAGFFQRFVNRWNLVKQDPNAARSEVVEPIVYYIDHTIPEKYRPYVREGIEAWQEAFEEAGLLNAIVARDAPDDPEFDPEDVRYNSIRWITSAQPSFGAIGPSRVDPRTGQILDADVLVEAGFVDGFRTTYARLIDTRTIATAETLEELYVDPMLRRLMESGALPNELQHSLCTLADGFAAHASIVPLSLVARGVMSPGDDVPMEFVGEGLKWVIMHEVGHTLGLRHNFKSSTDTPFAMLNDRAFVSANGLTGSVMDYSAPNVDPDASKQGYYYGPGIGTYDRWIIRYGYTPFGATTPDDEIDELMAIASEAAQPGHAYGTDEDTYPAGACDPACNIFDLSADGLAWAERQLVITDQILDSPSFEALFLEEGDEYAKLRRAMYSVMFTRFGAMTQAYKYFGGAHVSRDHYGDPDGKPPVRSVSLADQERALDLVFEVAFRADAWAVGGATLDQLALDRWSHWGRNTFSTSASYHFPLHGLVASFQASAVNNLLSPYRLQRMVEAEYKWDGMMTMPQLFGRVTDEAWSELDAKSNISSFRRSLQRAHVNRLISMAVEPTMMTPEDAEALARLQLERIRAKIGSRLKSGSLDDYTRAHLGSVKAAVDRALDAQVVTQL